MLIDGEEHDSAELCREFADMDRRHQTLPDTMPAECCRGGVPQGSDFWRGAKAVLHVLAAQERPGQGP